MSLKKRVLEILILILVLVPVHPLLAASKTSVIDEMLAAHGDLNRWRSAPTVSFEDRFLSAGEKNPMVSQVTVEQGRRRAYLDFPEMKARITWDGQRAWSENWKAPMPPRFFALLSYYFLNLPWLTKDPGVKLSEPGKGKLWDDPTDYTTVKMTFGPGVGDTPDDSYILYIDPKTHRLKACEYVATYAAVVPPGARATPPNILVYDEYQKVEGFLVPSRYSLYQKDRTPIAKCEIRNWSFKKPFDVSRMTMTPGAVLDSSKPK